jgi:uncharacterized membrane protein YfcA
MKTIINRWPVAALMGLVSGWTLGAFLCIATGRHWTPAYRTFLIASVLVAVVVCIVWRRKAVDQFKARATAKAKTTS